MIHTPFKPARTLAAVTTVRPPQRILDTIEAKRTEQSIKRSALITGALDCYLASKDRAAFPDSVRALYTELNSKLSHRPVPFSCSPTRLRSYRIAAKRYAGGSLSGLVSLAVAHCYND